jgi:hypothetical protein
LEDLLNEDGPESEDAGSTARADSKTHHGSQDVSARAMERGKFVDYSEWTKPHNPGYVPGYNDRRDLPRNVAVSDGYGSGTRGGYRRQYDSRAQERETARKGAIESGFSRLETLDGRHYSKEDIKSAYHHPTVDGRNAKTGRKDPPLAALTEYRSQYGNNQDRNGPAQRYQRQHYADAAKQSEKDSDHQTDVEEGVQAGGNRSPEEMTISRHYKDVLTIVNADGYVTPSPSPHYDNSGMYE